ncbi:ATP-binding protein [Mangrovicoccus sp. HB161399]|uniref:ATP-binding protein n=1 Tax=Mangrovicoccus sp. HB161399 TaxID=2720392 RepID=UPI0020A6ACE0|nr:ATP-binding protein [Mangrovicoccus sp. HB161399]
MEIGEDRYGTGSTVITSRLPAEAGHDVIDEPTFADAILDRVRHWSRTHGDAMAHFTTPTAWRSTARRCAKPAARERKWKHRDRRPARRHARRRASVMGRTATRAAAVAQEPKSLTGSAPGDIKERSSAAVLRGDRMCRNR